MVLLVPSTGTGAGQWGLAMIPFCSHPEWLPVPPTCPTHPPPPRKQVSPPFGQFEEGLIKGCFAEWWVGSFTTWRVGDGALRTRRPTAFLQPKAAAVLGTECPPSPLPLPTRCQAPIAGHLKGGLVRRGPCPCGHQA